MYWFFRAQEQSICFNHKLLPDVFIFHLIIKAHLRLQIRVHVQIKIKKKNVKVKGYRSVDILALAFRINRNKFSLDKTTSEVVLAFRKINFFFCIS